MTLKSDILRWGASILVVALAAGGVGLGGEKRLRRHQSAFLPRVSESWSREMRTATTKKIVALAIW